MFRYIYGIFIVVLMTSGFCGAIKEAESGEELVLRLISFFLYVPFIIWLIFN